MNPNNIIFSNEILNVKNLQVEFKTQKGRLSILKDLSFSLKQGEALGIVGESGSGKSVTSLSILRLLPESAQVLSGQVLFQGQAPDQNQDLLKLSESQMQKVRGKKISIIFQDPMTSLNPCYTVGYQIKEILKFQQGLSGQSAQDRALELLASVGIPDPSSRINNFPHEMSGGMSQRIMIAMAMACKPDILIADEPTTALDVTIQAQILNLLKKLRKENNMSLILVSHDIGVIAENTDRVMVMYAGEIVESGNTADVISHPQHPYTKGLLACLPGLHKNIESDFRLPTIPGNVLSLYDRIQGCQFYQRCSYHDEGCLQKRIEMTENNGRQLRCIHPL